MGKRRAQAAKGPKATARPQTASRPSSWLPVAALAALAFAAYANSVGNGFIGDDQFQLLRNPLVRDLSNIPRFFTSGVWAFLGVVSNYYRPLQFVLYSLIYQIAGFHAWAFHLFMVLLHAANSVLLFLFLKRIASTRIAWAAAALFALHPVHTETVDWAASLPDLAMTALALGGVYCFARQKGEPRGPQIAVHCGVYLLALWTKETGLMLAPLYIAFGFFCLGRRWQELRRNAALYAAMAATFGAYLAMRWHALGGFAPRQVAFFHLGPGEFALSPVVMTAQYLRMLVFPAGLNYFHVFHPTVGITPGFLAAAALLAGVAALLVRSRVPLVSFGIIWTALAIAPALNLTAVGQNVFTERYLYLPSAGFCWIAAWAWDWCAQRNNAWPKPAGIAVLALCAIAVIVRNGDWRDNFGMLQVTETQSPDSAWVHDALAQEFVERNAFDRALAEQRLAVQYDPGMALYHKKLGYILLGKDNPGAAVQFREADRLEPGVASNHFDLATALEASGDLHGAEDEYRRALDLRPQYPEARQGYERVAAQLR